MLIMCKACHTMEAYRHTSQENLHCDLTSDPVRDNILGINFERLITKVYKIAI